VARAQLDIDFFTPEAIHNPYPLYEQVRATGNVVWNGLLQGWMVTGFDAGSTVLNDEGDRFVMLNGDPEVISWFEAPNMITADGDYHRRLRAALAPLFTRRVLGKWERRVAEVVDELLAPLVRESSTFDLIGDFTMLPTVIVAEMLGVPPERHEDFRRWSHEIASNLAYGAEDPEIRAVMNRAAREVNDYLQEEIERHRREQPDDLLTAMLTLSGDSRMSDEEIRSTAVLLLIAGYDTTAKTMSNSLISLEANPLQREIVATDLSLVPAAIEESMRWYGSVQSIPRGAVADISLDGTEIAAGESVHVLIAAANRDPGRWQQPERFDVTRERKTHLAFGRGPHLCLGAALARLEVKVALERLLQAAPRYELRDIDFGHSFFVRGPESGLVAVGPAAI
jgi:cytochrome P450